MEAIIEYLNTDHLRWSWQVFTVVALTLLLNFIVSRVLKRLQQHYSTSTKEWDDALLEAARTPASILILVMGLSWAVVQLVVALSASNNFVSVSNPTLSMIAGPGGYRGIDLIRIGGPLSVLYLLVMLVMVNLVF